MDINKLYEGIQEDMKEPTQEEKEKYFEERTLKHRELVKEAARKIVKKYPEFKELLSLAEVHDESKFHEPQRTPYISISWRHKLENEKDGFGPISNKGYKTPGTLDKEEENKATLDHITNEPHHPEYWNKEKANLSKECRDKGVECIDVSKMPPLAISEMISDWEAMSEELKKNTAREWFEKQRNVRWHFSSEQEDLVDKLLKVFEEPHEGTYYTKESKEFGLNQMVKP